ncbi:hypothetical protein CONPUDRAFT_157317 [Coniophora puteana RWD-64-598 SS2]|uniref:Uncharacterized protein n=1 Tax=Coniophora puteana (strain RWD-64-598) TaxID=741705 RepID=A0A5M3MEL4_CONPW|nr:uncharacterized protein CONPUDRAFT_157317 [Coniophora puteana RWD-64-598 SS2]EIW77045.1 hypothetical protein CONPUDRAFT_157317 [Coniophora puteana RWD-64-598 SS2]
MAYTAQSAEAKAHAAVTSGSLPHPPHEVIVAAITYATAKAYEQVTQASGRPSNGSDIDQTAEMLDGYAETFIDGVSSIKEMPKLEQTKLKQEACTRAEAALRAKGEL